MQFHDILYGKYDLPNWLTHFIFLPEFVRLRGVRLSNIDSIQYKDFNTPTRWEHCIGVAYLAMRVSVFKRLDTKNSINLILASLLHDIGTPPFAHSIENIIDYDHELEAQKIISGVYTSDSSPGLSIYASQLSQFEKSCAKLSKELKIKIDPEEIGKLIVGEGELGYLINGVIDLDNADNVIRACKYMGLEVDAKLPLHLAEWLSQLKGIPIDIDNIDNPYVREWIHYRNKLYSLFYNASDYEIGREAFLHHIFRRALNEGFSRMSLIWNTDEGLLTKLENLNTNNTTPSSSFQFENIIQKYRLLEIPFKICELNDFDSEVFAVLKQSSVLSWIEKKISSKYFEPFLILKTPKYNMSIESEELFPASKGYMKIFKLGKNFSHDHLPTWMQDNIPNNLNNKQLQEMFRQEIKNNIKVWALSKPWIQDNSSNPKKIIENLNMMGNWSFLLSKNESIHPYPSTFVHAIPSGFINALGLKGELILDPFGGTGQTIQEVIKYGGYGISADSNSLASLITEVKMTYLSIDNRDYLRSLNASDIESHYMAPLTFDQINKWHHKKTYYELCQILGFIDTIRNKTVKNFLKVCFSSIITLATARRGKQHGFFADNTPLSKEEKSPPYQSSINDFLKRIRINLSIIERYYAFIEKNGCRPISELKKAKVLQINSIKASFKEYGVKKYSIPAIITSPPYLCMSDYTLGNRLSYYWLFPDKLDEDFNNELGARRLRSNPTKAMESYLNGFNSLTNNFKEILINKGYLALVLAEPLARSFVDKNILLEIDNILSKNNIKKIWEVWRPITWHRNYGYERIKHERLSVYINYQ